MSQETPTPGTVREAGDTRDTANAQGDLTAGRDGRTTLPWDCEDAGPDAGFASAPLPDEPARPGVAVAEHDEIPVELTIPADDDPAPATAAGGAGGGTPPGNVPSVRDGSDLPAGSDDGEEEEEEEPGEGEGGRMSLMEHLRELRTRLLWSLVFVFVAFLACWTVVEPIFDVLTKPLLDVLPAGSTAMYTTLPEAFFTRMYIAFITGLFVASPFVFYQIWAFISPGLYEEEKSFILPVAFISGIFFIAGGLFCYFIVFKYAFNFFVSFSSPEIVNMPKISDYLDFVLKLLLAFGFIFEMPIFAFFLSRMGIVTAQGMRGARRYAILVIFIVAAVLTPPDVVSQLLMAIPMLLLYEVSILVAAAFGRKKPVEEEAAEEETDEEADCDDGDYGDGDYYDDGDYDDTESARPHDGRTPATAADSAPRPDGSTADGVRSAPGTAASGAADRAATRAATQGTTVPRTTDQAAAQAPVPPTRTAPGSTGDGTVGDTADGAAKDSASAGSAGNDTVRS